MWAASTLNRLNNIHQKFNSKKIRFVSEIIKQIWKENALLWRCYGEIFQQNKPCYLKL